MHIVRRIPGGVKDDDPVGCNQVDAQTTGSGGNEEQSSAEVGGAVKRVAPLLAIVGRSLAVQTEVVRVPPPGPDLFEILLSKLLGKKKSWLVT